MAKKIDYETEIKKLQLKKEREELLLQKEKNDIEKEKAFQEKTQIMNKIYSTNNVDLIDKKLSWLNLNDYKTRYYRQFKKTNIIICNFELNNGHHTTALLPIINDKVIFKGGTYIVDEAFKYYHLGFKEWCLDYHEGFSMPIKRKIPLNKINTAMQVTNIGNISFATNPRTLRTFQINEVVRSAIQAAGITDFFKQVRLLVIISAIASVITLFLFANSQGYFSGITG